MNKNLNQEQPKKRRGISLVSLLCCIGIAGVVIGAGYEIVAYCKNKGGEA